MMENYLKKVKRNTGILKTMNEASEKGQPIIHDIKLGYGDGGNYCAINCHRLAETIPSMGRGFYPDVAEAMKLRLLYAAGLDPISEIIPNFTDQRDRLISNRMLHTNYPTDAAANGDNLPTDMTENEQIIANAYLNRFLTNEQKAIYKHMVDSANNMLKEFYHYRFFAERSTWTGMSDDFYRYVREARETSWFHMAPPTEDEIRVCGTYNSGHVTPALPGDTVPTEVKDEMINEVQNDKEVLAAAMAQMLHLHITPIGDPKAMPELTVTDDMLTELVDKTCSELGFSISAIAAAIGSIAKGAIGPIFAGLGTVGANMLKKAITHDPAKIMNFLEKSPLKVIFDGTLVGGEIINTITNILLGSVDPIHDAIESGDKKKQDEAVDDLFKKLTEVANGLDPKQVESFLNKIEERKKSATTPAGDPPDAPYYTLHGKKYSHRPMYGSDGKLKGFLPNLDASGNPIPYYEPGKAPVLQPDDSKQNLVPIYDHGEIVGYTRKPSTKVETVPKEDVSIIPGPQEDDSDTTYIDPAEISQMDVKAAAAMVEAIAEHFPELKITPPESLQKPHDLVPAILDPSVKKPTMTKPDFVAGTKPAEILQDAAKEGLKTDDPSKPVVNNQIYSGLLELYPWITQICDAANKYGVSLVVDPLGITKNEDGGYSVYGLQVSAFFEGNFTHLKSFSIDFGQMMDKRYKIFFNASANGFKPLFVCETAWNFMTPDGKTLETVFLEKIFSLGFEGLSENDQRSFRMYNSNAMQLNRIIEHSSIPTDKVKKDLRRPLKDIAFKAMRAIKDMQTLNNIDLGWFHIEKFDRDSLSMTMNNHGTNIVGKVVPKMEIIVTPKSMDGKIVKDSEGKPCIDIAVTWLDNVWPDGFKMPGQTGATEQIIPAPEASEVPQVLSGNDNGEVPAILNGNVDVDAMKAARDYQVGEAPSFCK